MDLPDAMETVNVSVRGICHTSLKLSSSSSHSLDFRL